jgi:hypothetical protein
MPNRIRARAATRLKLASDRLIHTFCKIANVVAIKTRHRNPSIRGHVNVCLFSESLRLGRVQTSKAVEKFKQNMLNVK